MLWGLRGSRCVSRLRVCVCVCVCVVFVCSCGCFCVCMVFVSVCRSFFVHVYGLRVYVCGLRVCVWSSCVKLYSFERRRERYMIMYVWKIISGTVPHIVITRKHHQRYDRSSDIQKIARESTVKTKTICSAKLKVRGCSLFNTFPKHIRNSENVTENCFKKQLDKFLESFPDQPCLPQYYKTAVSNSIINQCKVIHSS